jgi:hypothetical protein
MYVLKKLGLRCWGIATEQDIDFTSEASSASWVELFADTAKELGQDTFLDVLVLPDTWSEWVNKEVVNIGLGCKFFELVNFFLRENSVILV